MAGAEPQADNLIMQRYCPVCHNLVDMRRLSEATRPSDVADPWHFERHTREDYSRGTATRRICPGSARTNTTPGTLGRRGGVPGDSMVLGMRQFHRAGHS